MPLLLARAPARTLPLGLGWSPREVRSRASPSSEWQLRGSRPILRARPEGESTFRQDLVKSTAPPLSARGGARGAPRSHRGLWVGRGVVLVRAPAQPQAASQGGSSKLATMVTGPSLVASTSMCAPKLPSLTHSTPRERSSLANDPQRDRPGSGLAAETKEGRWPLLRSPKRVN